MASTTIWLDLTTNKIHRMQPDFTAQGRTPVIRKVSTIDGDSLSEWKGGIDGMVSQRVLPPGIDAATAGLQDVVLECVIEDAA